MTTCDGGCHGYEEWVHEGAAACSYDFALGTVLRFVQDGREVVCKDRGSGLQHDEEGRPWIDVWLPSPEQGYYEVALTYGKYTEVEVVLYD
jgi:hypothetical protein